MKITHIFYCHSPITFIVSLATIRELGIAAGDARIVWGRRYSYQTDIQSIKLPVEIQELDVVPSYGEKWLYFKHGTTVHALDAFLDSISPNSKIVLYLPSTRNFLMQAMATNRKVVDVSFIEEGLLSYTGTYHKKTNSKYLGLMGFFRRLLKWPWHFDRSLYYKRSNYSLNIYTINPNNDILNKGCPANFVSPYGLFEKVEYLHEPTDIFVFDALSEFGYCKVESILGVFELFLKKQIVDKKKAIIVRFHPIQRIQEKIVDILNKNSVSYVIDSCTMPLEIVLMQKKMRVYGFHSSLLLYAQIFGSETYSLSNDLMQIDSEAKSWYQTSMPKFFFKKVKSLTVYD